MSFQEVLVNRSVPQFCLQCLRDLSISPTLLWPITPLSGIELIVENNMGAIDGFENVNGVLVLEQPMQLMGDGVTNSIIVTCLGPRVYLGIMVYSSGSYVAIDSRD